MRKYKSEIYECLHEDFKLFLEHGKITPERMKEFEKDCFIETTKSQGRSAPAPTIAASSTV
ncbi:hypothetical protein FACS1894200_04810 [Spirochaetia bacterium]|nr:hypothetical protein FACS1894200_04810 [Spirochaetia bacterium]